MICIFAKLNQIKSGVFLLLILQANVLQAEKIVDNPFYDGESPYSNNKSADKDDGIMGPGQPDGREDLPIDDYIPLLIISALGLIVYQSRKTLKTNT